MYDLDFVLVVYLAAHGYKPVFIYRKFIILVFAPQSLQYSGNRIHAFAFRDDGNILLNNRGYAEYKLNKLSLALQDINRSLELYPENSFAYKNRALVYLAMKDREKACADLEKAEAAGFTQMYGDEVKKLRLEYCLTKAL